MECRICRGWIRKTIPSTKLNLFLSLVLWIVSNKVIVTIQGLRKKQIKESPWWRKIGLEKFSVESVVEEEDSDIAKFSKEL
jgi:hypothetical protein